MPDSSRRQGSSAFSPVDAGVRQAPELSGGVEVETKVSEAIDPRHYDDGFHSTATAGAIGAGAAAANLLGLDRATTAVALSIAASQAAGLRENFGTMTKPFHAVSSPQASRRQASPPRPTFSKHDAASSRPRVVASTRR